MERVSARRIVGGGQRWRGGDNTRNTNASLRLTSLIGHTVDSESGMCLWPSGKVTGWFWDNRGGVGFRLSCISALFMVMKVGANIKTPLALRQSADSRRADNNRSISQIKIRVNGRFQPAQLTCFWAFTSTNHHLFLTHGYFNGA